MHKSSSNSKPIAGKSLRRTKEPLLFSEFLSSCYRDSRDDPLNNTQDSQYLGDEGGEHKSHLDLLDMTQPLEVGGSSNPSNPGEPAYSQTWKHFAEGQAELVSRGSGQLEEAKAQLAALKAELEQYQVNVRSAVRTKKHQELVASLQKMSLAASEAADKMKMKMKKK